MISVCLSVCLSGHVYLCFYPSVCMNMHTERNIHVYVQTDRRIHVHVQTDRRIEIGGAARHIRKGYRKFIKFAILHY